MNTALLYLVRAVNVKHVHGANARYGLTLPLSGAFGYRVDRPLAFAYIGKEAPGGIAGARVQTGIAGRRFDATAQFATTFGPKGIRMRIQKEDAA